MEATRDHQFTPLSGSFALHALLVAALLWFFYQKVEEGNPKETIQIDTVAEKKQVKRLAHTSKNLDKPIPNTPSRPHTISLSDLGMRLNAAPVPEQTHPNEQSEPAENTGADSWDIMNPDPRVARFNQYIYNTVQGWLDRDAYLNMEQIYGTVKVRLWFTADGQWIEDETVYDAIDPQFKQIVVRALRKSFAEPIPHPYLFQHKKFSIERMVVLRH